MAEHPHPDIVIVGAGILGSALAWRLASGGICPGQRILVIDPNPAASQASSRAAALLSLSRSSSKAHWIDVVRSTLNAMDTLAGQGWAVPRQRCGALHLAEGATAHAALDDSERTAKLHGVPCARVATADFAARLPWLDMTRFSDALWFPDESYCDPYLLASAYAAAARAQGVRFVFGASATLVRVGQRVCVDGLADRLSPDVVWVAAGAWSSRVLQPLGLCAAQAAVRSQYWITGRTPLVPPDMPMVLAPDLRLYARPEVGGILFGLRESAGVAAPSALLPSDLSGFEFDPHDGQGHRTLESFADALAHYAPGLMDTGIAHYISGPSCYTPDSEFLVGWLPGDLPVGLLSGCNGAGIAASGGLADVAADCIARGVGSPNPPHWSPERFGAPDVESAHWLARCVAARSGKVSG